MWFSATYIADLYPRYFGCCELMKALSCTLSRLFSIADNKNFVRLKEKRSVGSGTVSNQKLDEDGSGVECGRGDNRALLPG